MILIGKLFDEERYSHNQKLCESGSKENQTIEFKKKQFEEVIQALKEDPYMPTQSFEKLRPTHEGRYSRRLNRQHRVVYKVDEENKVVEIYSAWTHYE